jgi:hypothetical protein
LITALKTIPVELSSGIGRLLLKAEQTTAIVEQAFHILQAVELFGLLMIALIRPLGQLQLHRLQALFQLHHPLGEGMGGLGQILSIASDPEGNGFRCHCQSDMMPITTHISSPAKMAGCRALPDR